MRVALGHRHGAVAEDLPENRERATSENVLGGVGACSRSLRSSRHRPGELDLHLYALGSPLADVSQGVSDFGGALGGEPQSVPVKRNPCPDQRAGLPVNHRDEPDGPDLVERDGLPEFRDPTEPSGGSNLPRPKAISTYCLSGFPSASKIPPRGGGCPIKARLIVVFSSHGSNSSPFTRNTLLGHGVGEIPSPRRFRSCAFRCAISVNPSRTRFASVSTGDSASLCVLQTMLATALPMPISFGSGHQENPWTVISRRRRTGSWICSVRPRSSYCTRRGPLPSN